eukprot:SAG11_NODE_17394_length_520_cov_0.722090_2_plen_81_part_01
MLDEHRTRREIAARTDSTALSEAVQGSVWRSLSAPDKCRSIAVHSTVLVELAAAVVNVWRTNSVIPAVSPQSGSSSESSTS